MILLVILCGGNSLWAESSSDEVKSPAWVLADSRDNRILEEHLSEHRLPPASLTKVMSAYLVFESLKSAELSLEDRLRVPKVVSRLSSTESRMSLVSGELVTVEDLLTGLIVVSANDAALTLAQSLGPGEVGFVRKMNQKARALGMMKTHFSNSTGLSDPKHFSTARDLAILALRMMRDHPEYFNYSAKSEINYKGFHKKNTNELLGDLPVDGMKTGYTRAAGWCVMLSLKHGTERLLVVVLGASSNQERFHVGRTLLQSGLIKASRPEMGLTL